MADVLLPLDMEAKGEPMHHLVGVYGLFLWHAWLLEAKLWSFIVEICLVPSNDEVAAEWKLILTRLRSSVYV